MTLFKSASKPLAWWMLPLLAALMLALTTLRVSDAASPGISTSTGNVAINGYDTVAYFVDGKATKGSPEHEVVWQDARWFFASADHKARFKADPSRYAPQFGGWCAAGVAEGEYYQVDAETWTIVDGKLYLNYDRSVAGAWSADRERNIAAAEQAWTSAANGR